ncbi:caspase family protein [Bradyrhizobium sp.]|uniref:caspase family protein n=1 Tax=Bradyrhizobium sp. TaxID=376 RepID=UPI003C3EA3D8
MRTALIVFLTSLFCFSADAALAEKRVALVIGISRYQRVPQLANPTRDAAAMSALFKKAGFDVVDTESDLGIAELRQVIRRFSETSRDADIAVVYYAGHGIEVDGINYLIPADARLASDFDVDDETISLDRLLRALDPVRHLKLVILDACRDNPFTRTMKRTVSSRSIGRGLAEIQPSSPDMLIAFAAKAGAVASDGDSENSPFSTALVKYIAEPGLDLRLAFGRVRDDVLKSTGNRQEPFLYGSLGGDTVALVPKRIDAEAEAHADYELAAQIGNSEAWNSFLAHHGSGMLADFARAQLAKLAVAQQSRARADEARKEAEAEAAQKAAELRQQLEEQSARQAAEVKQQLSEQARKQLDETRHQLTEQTQEELDKARRQVEIAQQQAEAARQELERTKREGVASARQQVEQAKPTSGAEAEKLASVAPGSTPSHGAGPPAALQIDPSDVIRLLQANLKRLGCNSGAVDGNWGDDSRKALELFNKNAHTDFDVKVASIDVLDAVRSKTERVCPLLCGNGQRVEGDSCVQITCYKGFVLNSGGACEKRAELATKARMAERHDPARRPRIAPVVGSGKCFLFGGRSYCQ